MSENELGENSPSSKFIHLKIRRPDGVKSSTTLKEGEFKVPIDRCINKYSSGIWHLKQAFFFVKPKQVRM